MSDHPTQRWQRWQPDELAAAMSPESSLPLPPPHAEPENAPQVDMQPLAQEQMQEQMQQHMQQQLRDEAYQQGFAAGQQAGFATGQQSGYQAGFQQGLDAASQQQAPLQARMQQLVDEFSHALDALDGVIASRLMQLALTAARQVIGQSPQPDSSALLHQIEEMLQQEAPFSGKPVLRVHCDDLQQVKSLLGDALDRHGWRLQADSSLHPGGCQLSTDAGDLDASLATRWQALCRLAAPGER